MPLGWDPSHDADRYYDELDKSANAELVWWQANGDRVLQMAAAIVTGSLAGHQHTDGPKEIIEMAARIVQEVTYRQEEPY